MFCCFWWFGVDVFGGGFWLGWFAPWEHVIFSACDVVGSIGWVLMVPWVVGFRVLVLSVCDFWSWYNTSGLALVLGCLGWGLGLALWVGVV